MTDSDLYPMLFSPAYKDYIWGGTRIADVFGRDTGSPVCAESWEIADRPEGMSVVANGPLAGQSLRNLMSTRRQELVGGLREDCTVFPLLIKIIDAREKLSVQVHPSDETSLRFGGEAKTEMWYLLDATPAAHVYAGLSSESNPESFQQAIVSGEVEPLLRREAVRSRDAVYMPGGRIHAIGEGCLILEVQQNSNTTYRVYDWGRVGNDGVPRELHVRQALEVINWIDTESPMVTPTRLARSSGKNAEWCILSCDHFHMGRIELAQAAAYSTQENVCEIIFCALGAACLEHKEHALELAAGTTCLVPAAVTDFVLTPRMDKTEIIRILPGPAYYPASPSA